MRILTGPIGIVGLLSEQDTTQLLTVAQPHIPVQAIELLDAPARGHVTFFHGVLKDAPLELLAGVLAICRKVIDVPIRFTRATDICHKFLALQDETPDALLQLAALAAVTLANWRDRTRDAFGVAEQLERSSHESLCEATVGHALAIPIPGEPRRLHMSTHYTNEYFSYSSSLVDPRKYRFQEIVLARMGRFGCVEEILR